jgi:hypothetical protein
MNNNSSRRRSLPSPTQLKIGWVGFINTKKKGCGRSTSSSWCIWHPSEATQVLPMASYQNQHDMPILNQVSCQLSCIHFVKMNVGNFFLAPELTPLHIVTKNRFGRQKISNGFFLSPKKLCRPSCNNWKWFRLSSNYQAFSIGNRNPFSIAIHKATKKFQSSSIRGPKTFSLQKFGDSKILTQKAITILKFQQIKN